MTTQLTNGQKQAATGIGFGAILGCGAAAGALLATPGGALGGLVCVAIGEVTTPIAMYLGRKICESAGITDQKACDCVKKILQLILIAAFFAGAVALTMYACNEFGFKFSVIDVLKLTLTAAGLGLAGALGIAVGVGCLCSPCLCLAAAAKRNQSSNSRMLP